MSQTIEDICRKIQNCTWIPGDLYDLVPKILSLVERNKELEVEKKRLRELLRDALPHIECNNNSQSGLITEIGEYLESPLQAPAASERR